MCPCHWLRPHEKTWTTTAVVISSPQNMGRGRRLQITDKESHVDLNGSSNGHAVSRPDLSLIVVDERLESVRQNQIKGKEQRIAYGVEFGACSRRSDTSSPLHQGKSQAKIEARVHSRPLLSTLEAVASQVQGGPSFSPGARLLWCTVMARSIHLHPRGTKEGRTLTRDRVHGSLRLAHDEPVHRS